MRKTVDFEASQVLEIQKFAGKHAVYRGNFSAVVREAVVYFFEQQHKKTCASKK